MGEEQSHQRAEGEGNVQAQDHSTAISQTNYYFEHVPPRAVDAQAVQKANQMLDEMLLEEVPNATIGLPHGSRLPPFGANSAFVGRNEDLRALARNLKDNAESARSPIAGVSGLGGVGKTQLAGEFVHRYGNYFEGGVYWLRFADPDNVTAEIVACGSSGSTELGSDFPMLPFDEKIRRVTATWQSALPRLLIFDDCKDAKLLAFWAPPSGGCRVLVTSRGKFEDAALGLKFLELDVLSRQQSIELLRKHLAGISADGSVLDGIAKELGDLPLALDLAGRFLVRFQATDKPYEYLADLRDADPPALSYHESLEGDDSASPTHHMMSVARTFQLDLRRLDATDRIDELALKVLARVARLAPGEPIPRPLLISTLGLPDGDPQARRQAERAILKLTELGLVQGEDDLRMHSLVCGVVVKSVEDSEARADAENAVLASVESFAEVGNLSAVLPLVPHLRFLANSIGQREDEIAGRLCFVLGGVLSKMQQDHAEALTYTERALNIMEVALGPTDPTTLRALLNQGTDHKALGHLDEAIDIFQKALKATRKASGHRHPETAYVHNNLGSALRDKAFALRKARYMRKARWHYGRALKIREKQRPQHPPDVAESLLNMGHLMLDVRAFGLAHRYLERCLHVDGNPPVPLDIRAKALRLLGRMRRDQGQLAEAHSYLSQSFNMYETALGPNHPQTKIAKDLLEEFPPPTP